MAETLQQAQFAVDRALGDAALSSVPTAWTRFVLTAKETRDGASASIAISVVSPGSDGIALVTDRLTDAVRALFLLFDRYGHSLRAIEYTFDKRPDGRWAFGGSYTYR